MIATKEAPCWCVVWPRFLHRRAGRRLQQTPGGEDPQGWSARRAGGGAWGRRRGRRSRRRGRPCPRPAPCSPSRSDLERSWSHRIQDQNGTWPFHCCINVFCRKRGRTLLTCSAVAALSASVSLLIFPGPSCSIPFQLPAIKIVRINLTFFVAMQCINSCHGFMWRSQCVMETHRHRQTVPSYHSFSLLWEFQLL